jgi:acylphosphatase
VTRAPGRVRRRVLASGRVQGVWFRDGCAREARAHGVDGWVRNLADGRVEAVFEGSERSVEAVVAWCRRGPSRAQVRGLDVLEEVPLGESGFAVR